MTQRRYSSLVPRTMAFRMARLVRATGI